MKKIIACILAVLMLTLSLVGCTPSIKTDSAYITDKDELIIGITLFAPMNYKVNNELVGFETEFAKAVCDKLGVTPKFQEINWDSKEVELNAKNIDCVWNGMTITEERKNNMEITDAYMNNQQVMVVKKSNLEKYSKGVDKANVVAEQGSAGETLATKNAFFKTAKFTPVDSMAKALLDVASGTSDVAIVDYVTSIGSIGAGTDFADLVVVETQKFDQEEYGIAFRKGSDMTAKVNTIMKELAAEGKITEIAKKYKLEKMMILK